MSPITRWVGEHGGKGGSATSREGCFPFLARRSIIVRLLHVAHSHQHYYYYYRDASRRRLASAISLPSRSHHARSLGDLR